LAVGAFGDGLVCAIAEAPPMMLPTSAIAANFVSFPTILIFLSLLILCDCVCGLNAAIFILFRQISRPRRRFC
jgi:hypothetical protein